MIIQGWIVSFFHKSSHFKKLQFLEAPILLRTLQFKSTSCGSLGCLEGSLLTSRRHGSNHVNENHKLAITLITRIKIHINDHFHFKSPDNPHTRPPTLGSPKVPGARGLLGPRPALPAGFPGAAPNPDNWPGTPFLWRGMRCEGDPLHRPSSRLCKAPPARGVGFRLPRLPGRGASGSGSPRTGSCGAAPPGRDKTLEPPGFSPTPGPPLPPFALASFLSDFSRSCPRLTRCSAASGSKEPFGRSATWLVTRTGSLSKLYLPRRTARGRDASAVTLIGQRAR